MATTTQAALSEMRPAISAQMTLAEFQTTTDLRIVNCTKAHGAFVGLFEPPTDKVDEVVWATIDKAFGEPVVRVEDRADYAATQVIAELLRSNGYDGIAYRSQFDSEGYNVALFSLTAARVNWCAVVEAKKLVYDFSSPSERHYPKMT